MTTEGDVRAARRAGRRRPGRPMLVEAMGELAGAADLAPSPLGNRPWRLRSRAGAVELLADTGTTAVAGPEQPRQTVVACGAALLNLRLAVAHLGVEPVVTVLPDPGQPQLLARVAAGPPLGPGSTDAGLHLAMRERRTLRAPFTHPFVPHEVMGRLADAVTAEGADLVAVSSSYRLRALDHIIAALPAAPDGSRARWSTEGAGSVLLLATRGDDVPDWLQAGQALQRLLLTATTAWLQARFHTAALEVPALRERVRRELCPDRAPQVIVELGQRPASVA